MKRSTFLTTLICLSIISGFAQHPDQIKSDSSFKKLSNDTSLIISNQPQQIRYFLYSNRSNHNSACNAPDLSYKRFGKGSSFGLSNDYNTFDKMPCILPKGFYPMNIVKPDTTVHYMILIKEL